VTELRPQAAAVGAQKRAKVLIVDDHPVVRYGLLQMLSNEPDFEVCGEAASAQEALALVESRKPDIAVVDISLKGTNGIELVKQIHAMRPEARILVSSMHDEKLFAERALRAGASGYINKQVAITEMVGALRRVLSGKVYLSPPMTERMVERAARLDSDASRSVIQRLSDRELEVFSLLGDGHSTREVAQRLNLSVKTIETHRAQIKRKLGLRNSTELIQRAVEWTLRQG
jgi:DNA-binding NarL/FixJ family response regulator